MFKKDMELNKIRNFCIIAHIDHGKSTLADRLLEITGTIDKRDMKNGQMLDTMELEQERGITIKLTPVRMNWKGYQMNIIDTPGHVDFQYEVSRSLASVEGALLIVDATQGIEAQTLSNVYMAIENDLDIIPVINKIDLPAADFDKVALEIVNLLGCDKSEIIGVSAKTGENVETILDEVIKRVSSPKVYSEKKPDNDELKALVFDSQYDAYRGVVSYVKVFQGEIKKGDICHFLNTNKKIEALDVGYFSPGYTSDKKIELGTIGYVVTGLKTIRDAKVGDTMWKPEMVEGPKEKPENATPIEGFGLVTPFIYAGIFAMDSSEYPLLKDAMEKLVLNDSSLFVETDVSPALGHGYRCGFLGLLHLEIVKERLLREFGMDVIMTAPQVTYRVVLLGDKRSEYSRFLPEYIESEKGQKCTRILISNPEELPNREKYLYIEEPIAKVEIITPLEYVGNLMQLSQDRRGSFKNQQFIDSDRVMLTYELPMNELIGDFYDEIKSLSSGYASLNYEFIKYSEDDLVKLEILIADEKVDALAFICHRKQSRYLGGKICANLKESIPKALFTIKIQAVVGGDVVGREDISAMRKDVTAKLYGGDITRKKKLLEKQKQGKKKMRQFGKISLPSEVFVNLLKK
ncbi:MAG: translation elongation factor 4 [Candidatus Gracilibacteria bacterium]|nr:translation elongation factor 4 [Candidatus Gracilibacteria bacterium]